MQIGTLSKEDISVFRSELEKKLNLVNTFERATEIFVSEIYQKFIESIVLLRLFLSIPYSELPENIQNFTQNLANGINLPINDKSIILTLLGTIGKKEEWNDRNKSKGHQGIPLASEKFIDSIPMLSALLEELGFDLGWIRDGKEILTHSSGRLGGTFYVEDASSVKDKKDRLIIPMQDFVKEFNIKTVFGFGGSLSGKEKFFAVICFTREHITRKQVSLFEILGHTFKIETMNSISDKTKYFK
jgi:hypothetical protein